MKLVCYTGNKVQWSTGSIKENIQCSLSFINEITFEENNSFMYIMYRSDFMFQKQTGSCEVKLYGSQNFFLPFTGKFFSPLR